MLCNVWDVYAAMRNFARKDMKIRSAIPDDIPALLAIYAPYVEQTAVTFEYDVPTPEEFLRRMKTFTPKYPYIVAEDEKSGRILGYAYAHAFHEREAYRYTVETTVYVDMQCRRSGAGRMLYEALEKELLARGFKNMTANISYIEKEDEYLTHDSVHFHRRMGFTPAAHFHKCGYKFDRWYGIVWMEKFIGKDD